MVKFQADSGLLSATIAALGVPQRSTQPIEACVLIDAKGENITLSSIDANRGVELTIPATVEAEGAIAIPAKQLLSDLAYCGDTAVIEGDDDHAIVTGSGVEYRIACLPPDSFPAWITLASDSSEFAIESDELVRAAETVAYAISSDETKRILTGLRLAATSDGCQAAATDGHRLSITDMIVTGEPRDGVTIPGSTVALLKKIIALDLGNVTEIAVRFDPHQAVFSLPGGQVFSRLLDGSYPNYQCLVPQNFEWTITADRKALLGQIKAVLHCLSSNIMDVAASGFLLVLSGGREDTAKAEVMAEFNGTVPPFSINAKYMAEALSAIEQGEVQIKGNTPTSPIVVSGLGSADVHLIMPVQRRQ